MIIKTKLKKKKSQNKEVKNDFIYFLYTIYFK